MLDCKSTPKKFTFNCDLPQPIKQNDFQIVSRSFEILFQRGSFPSVWIKINDNIVPSDVDTNVDFSVLKSQGLVSERQSYRKIFSSSVLSPENQRWIEVITESHLPDNIRSQVIGNIFQNLISKDSRIKKAIPEGVIPITKNIANDATRGDCGYKISVHGVLSKDDKIMISSFTLFGEPHWALPFGKVFRGSNLVNCLTKSVEKHFEIELSEEIEPICIVFSHINNHPIMNFGFCTEICGDVPEKDNVQWVLPNELPENTTEITRHIIQKYIKRDIIDLEYLD